MVKNCCVRLCTAVWQPNMDLSFFSFPINNEVLASQWKEVIPHKGTLGKYSYICSDHFNDSDFEYIGPKRHLKKKAVPSIFLCNFEMVVCKPEMDTQDSSDEDNNADGFKDATDNVIQNNVNTYEEWSKTLLQKETEKVSNLQRKVKILQARLRRRELKIRNMTSILKLVKRKAFLLLRAVSPVRRRGVCAPARTPALRAWPQQARRHKRWRGACSSTTASSAASPAAITSNPA